MGFKDAFGSTPNILQMSNSLKMSRPDTGMDSALVIPLKSTRGFANEEMVRKHRLAFNAPRTISLGSESTNPDGTAVRSAGVNVSPKALFGSEWVAGILIGHLNPILSGDTVPDASTSRHPSILQQVAA